VFEVWSQVLEAGARLVGAQGAAPALQFGNATERALLWLLAPSIRSAGQIAEAKAPGSLMVDGSGGPIAWILMRNADLLPYGSDSTW
jgi:hypothetical protein